MVHSARPPFWLPKWCLHHCWYARYIGQNEMVERKRFTEVLRRAQLLGMGTLNSRRSFALLAGAVSRNFLPIIMLCRVQSNSKWIYNTPYMDPKDSLNNLSSHFRGLFWLWNGPSRHKCNGNTPWSWKHRGLPTVVSGNTTYYINCMYIEKLYSPWLLPPDPQATKLCEFFTYKLDTRDCNLYESGAQMGTLVEEINFIHGPRICHTSNTANKRVFHLFVLSTFKYSLPSLHF